MIVEEATEMPVKIVRCFKMNHVNNLVSCVFQDGAIMDGDGDGDGVINLSQRPSAANTPNGSIEYEDSGQVRHL